MKIFISYSRIDAKETANVIHEYLTNYGHHEVFIDTSDIHGGDEWWNTIQNAISNCDIFVIIITPSALHRSEVEKEVNLAKNLRKKIIPCIAKDYVAEEEIKWGLNRYQGFFYYSDSRLAMDLHRLIKREAKTPRKTPDEIKTVPNTLEPFNKYSNALKQFSEKISDLFNKNNVSVDNKKIVKESIKQLVKDVESIQSLETIKNSEKDQLQIKIKNLIQKILKILPLDKGISESFSILTPLNDFLDKSNNMTINQLIEYEIQRKKNLFSMNVEKMVESYNKEQIQTKIILASSEATGAAREKINCMHSENDSPHSHGAFSYYLIEGLDGKAADPDTGIISIDSLRIYI